MRRTRLDGSFSSLESYLQDYGLASTLANADLAAQLQLFHRHLYGLLCWQLQFDGSKVGPDDYLSFNESVSDLLQFLLIMPQGLYKVCNVLHRSAIENFVRQVLWRTKVTPIPKSAHDLFDTAIAAAHMLDDANLRPRVESLRQCYGQLCNYVHSTAPRYLTLAEALRQYPAFDKHRAVAATHDAVRTMRTFNACLLVLFREDFNSMLYANKDVVLDNLTPSEKKALVTGGHSAIFSRRR